MSIWKYEKAHIMGHRIMGLIVLFLILGFVLIGRLFYLQVIQGEKYLLLAEKNRLSKRFTMPSRGRDAASTLEPKARNASSITRTSEMSGTFVSVTGSAVKSEAAIIGSAAFLLPETRCVPETVRRPWMTKCDIA